MEINVQQVTFSYDRKKDQLHNIHLQIQPEQITTIIGPNGCGKSTLLSVMSNNAAPRLGQIILDGKAIAAYRSLELARKLAVVHQQNEAPDDLTVEQLVRFGRMPHKKRFSRYTDEDEQAVEWALTCTNLQPRRLRTLDHLSGGERQRVWIAMALAQRTPVLFLDEPTTYLDMYYQLEIMELIHQLNREYRLTIVMVLHDINQALRYSDQIIAMKNGQIVAAGEPSAVLTAERIEEIYNVKVMLRTDEETGPYIVPLSIGQTEECKEAPIHRRHTHEA